MLSACGASSEQRAAAQAVTHDRLFSPTSIWNAPVPANAPLDPRSPQIVAALHAEVRREIAANRGPAINTTAYSVPVYRVPADQPMVTVKLTPGWRSPALRAAWRAVPLPSNARPASGTDHHLVVWQPSTDQLWEFWRLRHEADGWRAQWGGAMRDVSTSSGVYGPSSWPGATRWWGASASSLSIAGGLITPEDLERGSIDHALEISVPDVRAGVYALPAERTDGTCYEASCLPEGAHLRLDPNLDVEALHLPWLARMIAVAAQRYGFVVRDGANSVGLSAQDPTPTGANPFPGPNGYFQGPRAPLRSFPWERLQLLQMTLLRAE